MRVLVISNLGLVRHTIEQTLQLDAHTVTTVEGYQQALDVLRRDPTIDLIVTDWLLKGATAFDLYQAFRQIDRVSDQGTAPEPYFLITVTPDRGSSGPITRLDGNAESMIAIGCAGILTKPIDKDELRIRAQAVAQNRRPHRPSKTAPTPQPLTGQSSDEVRLAEIYQQLESLLEQIQTHESSARDLLEKIRRETPHLVN